MTVAILKDDFRAYTQRVTLDLDLKPRAVIRYSGGKEYMLPVSPDGTSPLLLVPEELRGCNPCGHASPRTPTSPANARQCLGCGR
jgi:hypothetical protein